MLSIESTLNLLRKYDFNSTTSHPYIYSSNDNIGLCYTYYDDDYGTLERVKFFDNEEVLEEFLKKYRWFLNNGRVNNVRMVLDNYQIMNPKVLFLRNNKIMVKGEMFDLENFKLREKQIESMDEISRTIYEAGNLLLIYDDIKNRQVEYFDSVKVLNNQVRERYFNLQKEVDTYNGIFLDRELVLQKQSIVNDGINALMETSIKDRYNQFKITQPALDEAQAFVREIWDLIMNLEINPRFYEAQATENNLRNEIRVVDKKLQLLKELNDSDDKFHKVNLIKMFRAINKECERTSVSLDQNYVNKRVDSIRRKYSYFDLIDFFSLDEYLKESIFNTNYDAIVMKYAKGIKGLVPIVDKPLNEIASDLFVQYRDNFSVEEQAVLVLYNSRYRSLIDIMLAIPDFNNMSFEQIKSVVTKTKKHSKLKSECFDQVKKGFLSNPANEEIKSKVFININFETYDTFLQSMIERVKVLKNINNKMMLTGDVKLFFLVKKVDEISSRRFFVVTNDLNSLKREITSPVDFIAVATMFKNLPILYSPYYVDFGNLYDKNTLPVYAIKENPKFELLIDVDDVKMSVDDTFSYVTEYASKPEYENDINIVSEVNKVNELNFCRLALTSNINETSVAKPVSLNQTSENNEQGNVTNPSTTEVPSNEIPAQVEAEKVDNQEQNNIEQTLPKVEDSNSNNNVQNIQDAEQSVDKKENSGGSE